MAFTKYASLESAQVLAVKGSAERVRTASLEKISDFEDYRTEDGYLYARIRAISSRVNKNHDGWPSVELAGGSEVFDQHTSSEGFTVAAKAGAEYGYSTFLGKPIFVDHHNSDPDRARGVIVDAKLHVDDHKTAAAGDPYYASAPDNHLPPTWVELLLEVDAKSFPRLAKAIIDGSKNSKKGIDGFSMGCDVERTVCNICKNSATSPDEYCKHVRLKGMPFDHIDGEGKKTSRKSYEDCYGIKFFEISAVFDPADETALVREVTAKTAELAPGYGIRQMICPQGCDGRDPACPSCHGQGYISAPHGGDGAITPHQLTDADMPNDPYFTDMQPRQGAVKTSDNPLPQVDMLRAPEPVDTTRDEAVCPVCGSDMDAEKCDVCNYIKPPDGFDNPDLTKARPEQNELNQDIPEGALGPEGPDAGLGSDHAAPGGTSNLPSFAHVNNEMDWEISLPSRFAGPQTDEPSEDILDDPTSPTTSSVRTASDFIAAAGATKRGIMNHRTADAASGAPAVATPDTNTDVIGVGGVQDASNEEASRADAQIDVTGVGGTGVTGVGADSSESVDQGDEHSKNIEAIPTKTFDDGSSAVERQADPVSNQPFPASEDGVKSSGWVIEALEAEPFPTELPRIGEGQSAEQGTSPADPVGNAQDRVDVLQPTTSPANNSGPTKTWSGTDGNGVTQQQSPVTNETLEGNDGVKKSHIFTALKLAELEVELGLLDPKAKLDRVAALEHVSADEVDTQLRYAERVKTAGLGKRVKSASRLPSLGRNASVEETKTASTDDIPDEAVFM